jgi:hypothetical protein
VLEPSDEYPHEPDAATNYNESMYLNGFDVEQEVGGWFRLGNRVNEGYAEMSVCLYLPGGGSASCSAARRSTPTPRCGRVASPSTSSSRSST